MSTTGENYEPSFKYILFGVFVLLIVYISITSIRVVFDSLEDTVYVLRYLKVWVFAVPQILLIFFLIIGVKTGRFSAKIIKFNKPKYSQMIVAVGFILINFVVIYVYMFLVDYLRINFLLPKSIPSDILGYGIVVYVNLFFICLVVPIVEEVFFRGFLLNAFLGKMRLPIAIFLSSAIFAIMHGSVGFFVPVFISSVMLSVLYSKTNTIWIPIMTHSLQNLFVVLIASSA